MNIRFTLADPAGNKTALVPENENTAALRREISRQLMAGCDLGIEQVGFYDEDAQPPHLQMMGGEFCGNAARSFGLMLAKRRGMAEGYLDISVSGMQQALKVHIAREDASVHLSTEHTFSSLALPSGDKLPVVELPGISHIIAENFSADPQTLAPILQAAEKQLSAPAVGVLFWNAEQRFLRPAVCVWAQGSTVFESSCGSGSLALAIYLKREVQSGGCSMSIAQPGGRIRVVLQKLDGALISCKIGGEVALTEMEAEIAELD
ncbi:MAG: hypothetical protein KH334_05860 [Clostridiales bacterium]|nr:hypothetical protein [Clostridiales bacterium]